ncbi:hypothetical protein D1007_12078 [Hordeum vulgare]|nr:hypothetical protein D1007_12078 [Hordeum vulgare]
MVKLTEKFEDILSKKEEAYVERSNIKEENKEGRFKLLMHVAEKKLALKEKRAMIKENKTMLREKKVKITTNAEDAKMWSLNLESLDDNARMIMQVILYKMLQL